VTLKHELERMVEIRRTIAPDRRLKYACFEDYVLQHGQPFTSQPLTKEEWQHVARVAGRKHYPIKQCFANSQQLAIDDLSGQIQYAEGYCFNMIPVLHGWNVLNGKVIDLTMRLFHDPYPRKKWPDLCIGEFPQEREYFGQIFPLEQVADFITRTQCWGSLIDDWKGGYPLLKAA
jgi:hypothetical protein